MILDTITSLLGGSTGSLLKSAGDIVARYLPGSAEKEAAQQELLKLQDDYNIKIQTLAQQVNQMYLADMDSARKMQMAALQQADTFSKRFVNYLAIVIVAGAFIFDYCMFFVNYPAANRDMLNMVAGVINTGALISVLQFYFGSSQSSVDKQKLIENIATSK
jgi:hypothetical protein